MDHARRTGRGGSNAGTAPESRRYELRWPSFVYIATALFLAVGAVNSQNNLLYWAFGAAVSGVALSGLISGIALMGVRLAREPLPSPSAGEEFKARYRVTNVHRFMPVFALVIEEIGAGPLDASGVRISPAAVAHCGAGEHSFADAAGHALRRGQVSLGRVRVTSTFPFGLVRKALVFDLPTGILVLPAVVPVRPRLGESNGLGRRIDAESAQRLGDGDEFYGIREYAVGDPLSSIAWKRSAALGTLVVRHTASPNPPRVWVDVDSGVFGATPREFELAVVGAASLFVDMERRGRAVGLCVEWAGLSLPPACGARSVRRALQALARLDRLAAPAPGLRRPSPKDGLVRICIGPHPRGIDALDTASWMGQGAELPDSVLAPAVTRRRPRQARGVAA